LTANSAEEIDHMLNEGAVGAGDYDVVNVWYKVDELGAML